MELYGGIFFLDWFMRYQEYRLKATIDAILTPYLISHQSQYFSLAEFLFFEIILTVLAYEIHPYLL